MLGPGRSTNQRSRKGHFVVRLAGYCSVLCAGQPAISFTRGIQGQRGGETTALELISAVKASLWNLSQNLISTEGFSRILHALKSLSLFFCQCNPLVNLPLLFYQRNSLLRLPILKLHIINSPVQRFLPNLLYPLHQYRKAVESLLEPPNGVTRSKRHLQSAGRDHFEDLRLAQQIRPSFAAALLSRSGKQI